MRPSTWLSAILVLSPAVVARPQGVSGVPAVDSASVARAAWGRAVAAFNAHDVATARKEVDRAAAAWPTQHAYVWARARFAAIAGDTAAALAALTAYADLGLGRDVRADTNLAGLRALPRFAAVAARHDANRAPVVRSALRGRLPDSTFWPEGMDYDSRTGRFYVASVRHRTIAELAPGGAVRELWPRHQPGIGSVLGVRVDPRRGVLWATLSGRRQMEGWTPADSTIAALVRVRIADGVIERRWDVSPVPRGHTLGDLAVGPNGDVFVTDSDDPVLYRLRPGADTLEHFTNPLFHSLQGLAPTPDGGELYLSDYSHGFLRVDLATNAVTRVADAPRSTSLGCDGIAWAHGSIIAVQNGVAPARIMRFVLDPSGQRFVRAEVLDQNSGIADEPAIGAVVGGEFIYVANGQWEKYSDDGVPKPGAHLTAPVLLAVPLGPGPNDMFPRWSPDGTRIVFTSDRDGDPEIYVMQADGSGPRRLTYSPGRDAHPFFSRDGSRIVFQSPRANGTDTNIYVMGSDGAGVVQLTQLKGFAGVPVYSPDEETIVFQLRQTSDFSDARKWRICSMGADGSNLRVLTPGEANDQVPTFSPDGKRLLFYSDRTGKDQLYTMRPDGGDVRRVASTASNDNAGSWSPDGRRIAFTSDRGETVDIYVMDADGTHMRRLTSLHATARAPVWSPDGRRILFSVDGLGPSAIFVVGADGTGLVRLISSATSSRGGEPDPVGRRA
jgi:Tol biopolymer transport system component